jgi:hypothetical protein
VTTITEKKRASGAIFGFLLVAFANEVAAACIAQGWTFADRASA